MAQKRRRRPARRDELPGFAWMLFGLAIGLAVALAVYLADSPGAGSTAQAPQPASTTPAPAVAAPSVPAYDDNDEVAEPPEQRFDFYDLLPNFEVVIPEQEPDVTTDSEPRAVVEPGSYILQAGSFTRYEDADRRRAQLALQGIESNIQRVAIDDRTYHRVRIGPISDLDELNLLRSRLRQANIDVLRIRLDEQ